MGTVDYYINDGFYSGENADQVTNRNSNSSPKQGFVREIMARPMIRIQSLDKVDENERNSNEGSSAAESVRKIMVFG